MVEEMMTRYSIDSDLSQVRELAAAFQAFSEEERLGDVLTGQLELILVEAVNNVIEHAYELKQGSTVDAQFEAFHSKVVITIMDRGLPVPEAIRDTEVDMPKITDLPEGGWGLGLINALADQVEHYTVDGLNIMVLTKKRTATQASTLSSLKCRNTQ